MFLNCLLFEAVRRGGEILWLKKNGKFFGEGPNLDILWVVRDEIGSARTRIDDLMTISVSKYLFIGYLRISDFPKFRRKIWFLKKCFIELGGNRGGQLGDNVGIQG